MAQKTILNSEELASLGLIPEKKIKMDEGSYQVHAITANDGFIEITNEFDDSGNLTKQYADIRIVRNGLTNLTYNELGSAIKRLLINK